MQPSINRLTGRQYLFAWFIILSFYLMGIGMLPPDSGWEGVVYAVACMGWSFITWERIRVGRWGHEWMALLQFIPGLALAQALIYGFKNPRRTLY